MLRLRHAIERASKRRWLGMLVVLVLAVLLVLVALQTMEEALVGPSLSFSLALILVAAATLAAPRPTPVRTRDLPLERGPPGPPGRR